MHNDVESDLLTVPQAAAQLTIKPRTMWKYIYTGQIDSVLIGRLRRVRARTLKDLIERNTIKAKHEGRL